MHYIFFKQKILKYLTIIILIFPFFINCINDGDDYTFTTTKNDDIIYDGNSEYPLSYPIYICTKTTCYSFESAKLEPTNTTLFSFSDYKSSISVYFNRQLNIFSFSCTNDYLLKITDENGNILYTYNYNDTFNNDTIYKCNVNNYYYTTSVDDNSGLLIDMLYVYIDIGIIFETSDNYFEYKYISFLIKQDTSTEEITYPSEYNSIYDEFDYYDKSSNNNKYDPYIYITYYNSDSDVAAIIFKDNNSYYYRIENRNDYYSLETKESFYVINTNYESSSTYMVITGIDLSTKKLRLDYINNGNENSTSYFSDIEVSNKNYLSVANPTKNYILLGYYVDSIVYFYLVQLKSTGATFNYKMSFKYENVRKIVLQANNTLHIFLFVEKKDKYWYYAYIKFTNKCDNFTDTTNVLTTNYEKNFLDLKGKITSNYNIIASLRTETAPDLEGDENGNNYLLLTKDNIPTSKTSTGYALYFQFRLFIVSKTEEGLMKSESMRTCNFTISYICNQACDSCENFSADPNNPNCTSCKDGYTDKYNNGSTCIDSEQEIDGYYYDSNSETFKECYNTCKTCSGESYNECESCWENYGLYEGQCISSDVDIDYYYYDSDSQKFLNCIDNCISCSSSNDCYECDDGYCLYNDEECYENTYIINNYYCDTTEKEYYECDSTCLTCSDSTSTSCLSCDYTNNNLCLDTDNNECLEELEGYYCDENTYKFKECDSSCSSCSGGTYSDCITCNTGYYLNSNNQCIFQCGENCKSCNTEDINECYSCNDGYGLKDNKCVSSDTEYEGYYYDEVLGQYLQCDSSCNTCYGVTEDNCLTCSNSEYVILEGKCYSKDAEVEGYYYNSTTSSFKKCYKTCKTCNGSSSDNCLSCYDNYYLYNNQCNYYTGNIEDYYNDVNTLLAIVISQLSEYSNNTILYGDNYTVEIYNTSDESIYISESNSNVSTVDLGDCEYILKSAYEIEDNETLTIILVQYLQEGESVYSIDYYVYYDNEQLDLSLCNSVNITTSSPLIVSNDDYNLIQSISSYGYDPFDTSDQFYNDICSLYSSSNSTDVTIEDRKSDFYLNLSLCEENCVYSSYNTTTNKVSCDCSYNTTNTTSKIEDLSLSNIKNFVKNAVSEGFKNVVKNSNIFVVKCYKKLFCKDGILYNYGSWIMLIFIFINIILAIIFSKNGITPLLSHINRYLTKYENRENNNSNPPYKNNKDSKNNVYEYSYDIEEKESNIHINKNNNDIISNSSSYNHNSDNFSITNTNNTNENYDSESSDYDKYSIKFKLKNKENNKKQRYKSTLFKKNNNLLNLKENNYNANKDYSKGFKRKSNTNRQIKNNLINLEIDSNSNKNKNKKSYNNNNKDNNDYEYADEELNDMNFDDAVENDHRNFLRIYWSLVKYDQLIIFTFFTKTDYNLRILKISLFLCSMGLFFVMSALFYDDDDISHVYKNGGVYDFLYEIPDTIFSTVCCFIINFIIEGLSLSHDKILELNEEKKSLKNYQLKMDKVVRCIRIKTYLYFICSFIFLITFWYYVGVFCAVFKNNQKNLFLSMGQDFLLSMISPFYLDLIPTTVRIISLRYKKKFLYCLSKILQML